MLIQACKRVDEPRVVLRRTITLRYEIKDPHEISKRLEETLKDASVNWYIVFAI